MITDSKLMFGPDGSYIVFVPNFLDMEEFGENTFIAHMEGTPKVLFREWMKHKDEVVKGRLFYCTSTGTDFFKNRSEEIAPGVFEYVGEKYR